MKAKRERNSSFFHSSFLHSSSFPFTVNAIRFIIWGGAQRGVKYNIKCVSLCCFLFWLNIEHALLAPYGYITHLWTFFFSLFFLATSFWCFTHHLSLIPTHFTWLGTDYAIHVNGLLPSINLRNLNLTTIGFAFTLSSCYIGLLAIELAFFFLFIRILIIFFLSLLLLFLVVFFSFLLSIHLVHPLLCWDENVEKCKQNASFNSLSYLWYSFFLNYMSHLTFTLLLNGCGCFCHRNWSLNVNVRAASFNDNNHALASHRWLYNWRCSLYLERRRSCSSDI